MKVRDGVGRVRLTGNGDGDGDGLSDYLRGRWLGEGGGVDGGEGELRTDYGSDDGWVDCGSLVVCVDVYLMSVRVSYKVRYFSTHKERVYLYQNILLLVDNSPNS